MDFGLRGSNTFRRNERKNRQGTRPNVGNHTTQSTLLLRAVRPEEKRPVTRIATWVVATRSTEASGSTVTGRSQTIGVLPTALGGIARQPNTPRTDSKRTRVEAVRSVSELGVNSILHSFDANVMMHSIGTHQSIVTGRNHTTDITRVRSPASSLAWWSQPERLHGHKEDPIKG